MEKIKRQTVTPKWRELALGAEIIHPGSARALRTGDWRSSRPVWHYAAEDTGCVQCGMCVIFCPEGCIFMKKLGETGFDLKRLKPGSHLKAASPVPYSDNDYCKGCGICAKECWTGCIEMVPEEVL